MELYADCRRSFWTTVKMNIGTNQTGEPMHHGETKSKPLDLLMAGGDGTIELVEDFLAFHRRYAAPGIGEHHQRVAVLPVGRKLYLTTFITIFRGVRDEVAHDDAQRIAVGVDGEFIGRDVHRDVQAPANDLVGIGTDSLTGCRARLQR